MPPNGVSDRIRMFGPGFLLAVLATVSAAAFLFTMVRATYTFVEPCLGTPGSIVVTATSAFPPLTYKWSSTVPGWMPNPPNDPTQTGLMRGKYTVEITNDLGRRAKRTITLGGLESVALTTTSPSGFLTEDGALEATASPPGEACNFAWSDGSTTAARSNLDPGIHTVQVTDATSSSCAFDSTNKLLPAYATACTDWETRNPDVHPLGYWCDLELVPGGGGATVYRYRNEVTSLLAMGSGGPLVLPRCSGTALVSYSNTTSLLQYFEAHPSLPTIAQELSYSGPALNPPALSPNHLAAQLFVTKLNIRNVRAQSPAVPMEDAVYLGHPFHGYTVAHIVRLAERALGCGEDEGGRDLAAQDFVDLHEALAGINDGGFYLACPVCNTPFFELVGDLPGGDVLGEMTDLSADGQRAVGYSSADDPAVPNDGPGPCLYHWNQGQAYIRPCGAERFFARSELAEPGFPQNNAGLGLMGLGYFTDPTIVHAESHADGISPDGAVVVGYATKGAAGCGENTAVVFKGASILELQVPAGTISTARDVTNASVVAGPTSVDGPFGNGKRIAVGYVSTGTSHPFTSGGAKAVYWDPAGMLHDLPFPANVGSDSILSAEAIAVSDDGSVIAGALYYHVGDVLDRDAFACLWTANSSGAYDSSLILENPPGGENDARVVAVSGDGRAIVGYGWDAIGERAIVWRGSGASWDSPDVLPMITGGEKSFASGVNYDGSVIVGSCVTNDYGTHFAARWTGNSVANIVNLLSSATPPVAIPAGWELQAVAVSRDGKTIVGTGYDASGQQGWMARLP